MDPRTAYRLADARSNSNCVHLVILLYEQVTQDLRRAIAAIECGDIERRTSELDHALLVIGHLRATLDLERGAEVAQNLDRFYGVLSNSLMEAQVTGASEILQSQIGCLLSLREAWLEVEKVPTNEDTPAKSGVQFANSGAVRANWSA